MKLLSAHEGPQLYCAQKKFAISTKNINSDVPSFRNHFKSAFSFIENYSSQTFWILIFNEPLQVVLTNAVKLCRLISTQSSNVEQS